MSKKGTVDAEERAAQAKRIAVGATIAGVLLVIFLVIVLVVQFVKISVRNNEKRRLESQIDEYERLIKEGKMDLEFYNSEQGLRRLAVQHGWVLK